MCIEVTNHSSAECLTLLLELRLRDHSSRISFCCSAWKLAVMENETWPRLSSSSSELSRSSSVMLIFFFFKFIFSVRIFTHVVWIGQVLRVWTPLDQRSGHEPVEILGLRGAARTEDLRIRRFL